MVEHVRDMPFAPGAMMAAFVAGGLVMFPVTLLIVVTLVVFGPWYGAVLALCGTVLSAAGGYTAGRLLGRHAVRRLGGRRLNRLSHKVRQHGVLAMVVLRLVPVAPFTLVNLVVGASRIRLRDCLLGTAIGMTPGILITASLVDRIAAVAKDPGAGTFALLALVLLIPITVAVLLRRRRKRRERAANAERHAAATATATAAARHPPACTSAPSREGA
ncbi:TVP38/TMEM64 family inner membrane protein YdjZ [compost metagenome]